MTDRVNAGLAVAMQSALAAAKTISAVTLAAPGVFTSASHGFSNGDWVLLEIAGMHQINYAVFEVANVATDTFQVVGPDGSTGIDTSGFAAFTSGTAKKITWGTSILGVTDFSSSGGEIQFIDTTTIHDLRDTQVASGVSAMSYSLTLKWNPADAGQSAMKTAYESGSQRAFRITWPDGAYAAWYGSVGYSGAPGGGRKALATTTAAIAMSGPITVAA